MYGHEDVGAIVLIKGLIEHHLSLYEDDGTSVIYYDPVTHCDSAWPYPAATRARQAVIGHWLSAGEKKNGMLVRPQGS